MFRKIIIALVVVLGLSVLAGCSLTEQEYVTKYLDLLNWKYSSGTMTFDISVQYDDLDLSYLVTSEVQSNSSTMQNCFEISAVSRNSAYSDIKPFKMYVDGINLYVARQGILDIAAVLDQTIPDEFFELLGDAEYVMINMEELSATDPSYEDFSAQMYKDILADPTGYSKNLISGFIDALPGFTLGLEKENDSYVLILDNSNLLATADSFVMNLITNIDTVLDIYPLPEDMKASLAEEIGGADALLSLYKEFSPEIKASIQESLDTGTIQIEYRSSFPVSSYKSNLSLIADYPDFKVDITADQYLRKESAMKIDFPQSVADMTTFLSDLMLYPDYSDYGEEIFPLELGIDIDTGEMFSGYYGMMENLNLKFSEDYTYIADPDLFYLFYIWVEWDEDLQQAYVYTDEGNVYLQSLVFEEIDGPELYIRIRDLVKLGAEVDWDESNRLISIVFAGPPYSW